MWVQFEGTEGHERFTSGYKDFLADGTEEIEAIVDDRLQPFFDLIESAEESGFGSILTSMGISADNVDWLILDRASTQRQLRQL